MIKFRLYYDKDAETEWLNQMAAEGWAMKKFFSGFFFFEKCEKGKWTYQIDFGDKLFTVSKDYREFMEDTGAEIVQSWGFWIILRKLTSKGKFELYSDVDSQIEHYSKIRKLFKGVTILELFCLCIEVFAGMNGKSIGYVFAFLIGVIVLGCLRAVVNTNDIISELEERKTGIEAKKSNRNISPILPAGLLINSCAIMLDGSVSEPIRMVVQIIAIVVMLAGLVHTCQKRH